MEDVSFKMMGHWGHLDMYKWSYGQKFTCKFVKFRVVTKPVGAGRQ